MRGKPTNKPAVEISEKTVVSMKIVFMVVGGLISILMTFALILLHDATDTGKKNSEAVSDLKAAIEGLTAVVGTLATASERDSGHFRAHIEDEKIHYAAINRIDAEHAALRREHDALAERVRDIEKSRD